MKRRTAALGSALFFLAVPSLVAGLVPWLLTGWQVQEPFHPWAAFRVLGALLLLTGLAFLVAAFVRFAVEGLGTPAPIAPPERLVVGGPYRHVRNPMYVAVLALFAGQAPVLGHLGLLLYAAAFWSVTAALVRWYEEPTLARRFGADYEAYRRSVPAWLPRLKPWEPKEGNGFGT